MTDRHPLHYLLPAITLISGGLGFWHATGASLGSIAFWQAAGALLLAAICGLSLSLFRNVSRLYPLLRFRNPFRNTTSKN